MRYLTFIFILGLATLLFSNKMVTHHTGYAVGDKVENFTLTNIDDKEYSLDNFTNQSGIILIFTCNHCPFSVMYEDRIIELQ